MNPEFSKSMRASVVGRARFIEDLVQVELEKGTTQYVNDGAGSLDTFAFRHPERASRMRIFEIDQPGPQKWKQNRIAEMGLRKPAGLHFVPVNFENQSWWKELVRKGFDPEAACLLLLYRRFYV